MPALLQAGSIYDYDEELSGVDWGCEQSVREDIEPMKKKRKYKHGDYRLTPVGRVILATIFPFFISAFLFVFIVASENETLPGLIVGSNAIASFALSVIVFAYGISEEDGAIQRHPLWAASLAMLLALPALVIALIYIAVEASVEKVGEQTPRPDSAYDDRPEPIPPPEPPGWT
jgi:hypothetical protein